MADSNTTRPLTTTGRRRALACLVLIGLTMASGAAYRLASRWQPTTQLLQTLASRLDRCAAQLDSWRVVSTPKLNDDAMRLLEPYSYINRIYEHRGSGKLAHAAILLGPTGSIAVHTPDLCYSVREYEMTDAPRRFDVRLEDGTTHQFWTTAFRRRDAAQSKLRVYHAWCTDGHWQAPGNTRVKFALAPYLYKCQIVFADESTGQAASLDRAFLANFVRATHECCGAE